MAETSKIAWTDSTFNPWIGCTKVGPGCDNCYAEAFAKRTGKDTWGNDAGRFVTKGPWNDVLKWQRNHEKFFTEHGRKRRVFCASLADVFDNQVDPALRERLWGVMEQCPDLNFQIVTKRIGNLAKMIPLQWAAEGFPTNVGVMSTIVNQQEADRDIPKLLDAKSAFCIKWVGLSMEPLLGPVDLTNMCDGRKFYDALRGHWWHDTIDDTSSAFASGKPKLDWVIVGGESGPKHRPFDLNWARSLRDQCSAAGTTLFFKQVGALRPDDSMIPPELMVRQYPQALQ